MITLSNSCESYKAICSLNTSVFICRVTPTSRCRRFCATWRTARWCSSTGGTSWWRKVPSNPRRAHRRSDGSSKTTLRELVKKEKLNRLRGTEPLGVYLFGLEHEKLFSRDTFSFIEMVKKAERKHLFLESQLLQPE